jgi:hypothetical protein
MMPKEMFADLVQVISACMHTQDAVHIAIVVCRALGYAAPRGAFCGKYAHHLQHQPIPWSPLSLELWQCRP